LHAQASEIASLEGEDQLRAMFYPTSAPMEEALERYIFLQHRRNIASRRSHRQR
jgi:hypothetical protein